MEELKHDYPWTKAPLICSAPMRLLALAPLTVAVSQAGGLGFIGAGSDISTLSDVLDNCRQLLSSSPLKTAQDTLPFGIGFLNWGAPLNEVVSLLSLPQNVPAAIWFFAPREPQHLQTWTEAIRKATGGRTKIWIQVGTVAEALFAVERCQPDTLVVQGQDAGGHGLTAGASIVPLLPETITAVKKLATSKKLRVPVFVAAGGILEGSGVAAALSLGAAGATMGTRFLAADETTIAKGYQDAVLRTTDGGVSTVRTHVYDFLRGTTDWPAQYGGRAVINSSFIDAQKGLSDEENKKLYDEALKTGDDGWKEGGGRLTAYAGTGVGLVTRIQSAGEIVVEVREDCIRRLTEVASAFGIGT